MDAVARGGGWPVIKGAWFGRTQSAYWRFTGRANSGDEPGAQFVIIDDDREEVENLDILVDVYGVDVTDYSDADAIVRTRTVL